MTPEEEVSMLREEVKVLRNFARKCLAEKGIDVKTFFAFGRVDATVAKLTAADNEPHKGV